MVLFRNALIAAALAAPLCAHARPMTPEDVARIEQVGAVAVAPDGSRLAYTRSYRPDITKGEKNEGRRQQLYVTGGPGDARAFLPADMNVHGIGFSPDSRTISFLWHKDDEKTAVWGIAVDGGAQVKLAEIANADVLSYSWAPDGASIYLLAGPEEGGPGEKESKAGFNAIVYEEEPALNRLFQVQIGGEAASAPRQIAVPGYVTEVQVAPDGNWAVLRSAPSPSADDGLTSMRLHILDLASGNIESVLPTAGKLGDMEISPDGRLVSLVAAVDEHDPAATTLYLADTASWALTALNEGAAEAAIDTEWMADGRLAVSINVGARSVVRLYNQDGTVEREIDPGALIVGGLASGGNRLALEADAPTHPSELFVWDGQSQLNRWTDHNPWLAEIDFGAQRAITYAARDGQAIEGVLIEPVGQPPLSGSPTIIYVHGGPETHISNGWLTAYSMPGQVAAGRGYAVFHPNYRGSTGYGVTFAKQHQGRFTDPEFTDLVDGKNALVAMLVTDPARTGITGGSYGGYATAWGATAQSEEFAAGVMFVGLSNVIGKFGTGDIPREMYLVHSLEWPWDDWQGTLEVSPIYHAGKANTPLLILHGTNDTRVNPAHSLELYRHIKLRTETPVRLVLYPGEGHGNNKAAARYDYNLRMMEWFDTYLKTGNRAAAMPPPRPKLPEGTVK